MKKLFFPLIIMMALFIVTGCSEKFNIAAPYKNISVIYSFLDRADTAHYVRIQKAFLDQNKSAITMAKDYDSSFYKNINVRMDRISIHDQSYIDSIHLSRVNLDDEGYPKQPGTFFTSPNYAYKFKADLDPSYLYRVVVTNLTTGQVDSAISPVIDDVTPGKFSIDVIDDHPTNLAGMDFSNTQNNTTFDIGTYYTAAAGYNYQNIGNPVCIAYPVIRFHWADSSYNGTITTAYYDFSSGSKAVLAPGATFSTVFNIRDIDLYNALAVGMGTAPPNVARLLDRVEIFMYMTTLDYLNYSQSSSTQGVGLTGNEIEPVYTNIKGNNGALGLFTARGMHSGFITMTYNTVDSLMVSPILSKANIRGTIYH